MRRPEYLYLHEMRDAVVRIIDIVGTSSRAEIEQDRNRADALMWNYTVLGEAAAGLPQEFRDRHAGIAWRRPIGLRNRIVHGYWSTDMEILVVTAVDDLPDLLARLNRILSALDPGGPVRLTGKVVQRAHGGALLCGPLAFRWTTAVRPSFSRAECASRRPGRGGAGRRGPRDRRVTAEHVT